MLLAACGGSNKGGDLDAAPPPDATPPPCTVDSDCDDISSCTADTCVNGECQHQAQREGENCNDLLACTENDICINGSCVGEPVDCSVVSDFCNVGSCDEAAGGCVGIPRDDGTSCDDGKFCTVNDHCTAGACMGDPRDCSAAGDACNTGVCDENLADCVPMPVSDGTTCDDGKFCTDSDSCQSGRCVGGPPHSCDDSNACTTDSCSSVTDSCVNDPVAPTPGAEGPVGDATCSDSIDNDCDGKVNAADSDCVQCTTAGDCDDGNACTTDSCSGFLCVNTPLTGTTCSDGDPCTDGDQCDAGSCVSGGPANCADGDSCTVNGCDASGCYHDPLAPSATSVVGTSSDDGTPLSVCLAAGTGARVVVWTALVNTGGGALSGANVTIGGVAAAESTDQPGTYFRVVSAAAAPQSESLAIVATACGQTVTLASTVSMTYAPANSGSGGTGGCAPASGNLRVRVVADETGQPVAGASVLIGQAEDGAAFETSAASLFGGSSSAVSNVATTDANGYVEVYDYSGGLDGAITVTAGTGDRAYFTFTGGHASDVVLPLPLLHPAPPTTTVYDLGTAVPDSTSSSNLDLAVVLPKLGLSFFSDFQSSRFFTQNRCWDSGNSNIGVQEIPANVWVADQCLAFLCLGGHVNEATWSLQLANGVSENVELAHVRIPLSTVNTVLSGGGTISDLLGETNYRRIGFDLGLVPPAPPTSGVSIDLTNDYSVGNTPNRFQITFSGQPTDADLVGTTIGDYSGGDGTGDLVLLGHEMVASGAGSTVSIPNTELDDVNAPSVRRLASITATYINPANHPSVPANRLEGTSTVLLRDDGSGNEPFGPTGGSASVTSFLDVAATTFTGPRTFTWDNARGANGNEPLYSRHELGVLSDSYLPVTSCGTTNEERSKQTPEWIVLRPFDPSCSGDECFTLPVLPASFPRASSGAQKKSGFEALAGSGASCNNAGDCAAGESCVDPDGSGPNAQMCMGGAGTAADPYVVQSYQWVLRLFDLELAAPGWSFDAFELSTLERDVTHESTNRTPFQ